MLDVEKLAKEYGFDEVALVSADMVETSAEFAALCTPEACEHYGTCWTCPPGAGTFEEIQPNIKSKRAGVIVQTIRDNIDYFEDLEELAETRNLHHSRLDRLAADMRAELDGVLEFSTGGCDLCSPCTYPDAPCNKPVERRLALSAHGVAVNATCENAGLDYAFQNGRIRFIGLIMYD